MTPMDDRDAVCWLHRRAGFGLHPTELEAAVARGPEAELDRLLAPDAAGVPADPDPWDDARLGPVRKPTREQRLYAIGAWLAHMTAAGRPFEARLTWILHGWLVSSMNKVRSPRLLAGQIRLYRRLGAGSFPDLLAAVTVDPAMLDYLDGRTSTGAAPNENYGRELMELFGLGVGNFGEPDVKAGARALTGWVLVDGGITARFVPRRHDDTPQRYLGRSGVHDVATVVAALTDHPAHRTFVATRVCRELLGVHDPTTVGAVAAAYESGDGASTPRPAPPSGRAWPAPRARS